MLEGFEHLNRENMNGISHNMRRRIFIVDFEKQPVEEQYVHKIVHPMPYILGPGHTICHYR